MNFHLRVTVDGLAAEAGKTASAELSDLARSAGDLLYLGGVARLAVEEPGGAAFGGLRPEGQGVCLYFPAGLYRPGVAPAMRFFLFFRALAHAFNRLKKPEGQLPPPEQAGQAAELWQIYLEFFAQAFAAQAVEKLFPGCDEIAPPPADGLGASPAELLAPAWAGPPLPGLLSGPGGLVLGRVLAAGRLPEEPGARPACADLARALYGLYFADSYLVGPLLPLYRRALSKSQTPGPA